jgi:mannose-6-phosphate isomerase-like protein (cupin superfamily)
LNYTRLGVNDSGETYFAEGGIELNLWPSGLAMVSLTEPSESIRYFKATTGWQMLELHYAPKRQYLLVLHGVLEIHTSTEQIKQFKQGSILLVEDTYGKGHRTRNAGNEDLVLVWVGVQK